MKPLPPARPPQQTNLEGYRIILEAALLLAVRMLDTKRTVVEAERESVRRWVRDRAEELETEVPDEALAAALASKPSDKDLEKAVRAVQLHGDLEERERVLDFVVHVAQSGGTVPRRELKLLLEIAESLGWNPTRVESRWGIDTGHFDAGPSADEVGRFLGRRFIMAGGAFAFVIAILALGSAAALLFPAVALRSSAPPKAPQAPGAGRLGSQGPPSTRVEPPPETITDLATEAGMAVVECDMPIVGMVRVQLHHESGDITPAHIDRQRLQAAVPPGSGAGLLDLLGHSQAPFSAFQITWPNVTADAPGKCTVTEITVARLDIDVSGFDSAFAWELEGCAWQLKPAITSFETNPTRLYTTGAACEVRVVAIVSDGTQRQGPWRKVQPVIGEATRFILEAPGLP